MNPGNIMASKYLQIHGTMELARFHSLSLLFDIRCSRGEPQAHSRDMSLPGTFIVLDNKI